MFPGLIHSGYPASPLPPLVYRLEEYDFSLDCQEEGCGGSSMQRPLAMPNQIDWNREGIDEPSQIACVDSLPADDCPRHLPYVRPEHSCGPDSPQAGCAAAEKAAASGSPATTGSDCTVTPGDSVGCHRTQFRRARTESHATGFRGF